MRFVAKGLQIPAGGFDLVDHHPVAVGEDAVQAAADLQNEIRGFDGMLERDFGLVAGRPCPLDFLVGPEAVQRALRPGEGGRQVAGLQGKGHQGADGNGQAGFQQGGPFDLNVDK